MSRRAAFSPAAALLALACLGIIALYSTLLDLKPLTTDEGFRLWIIHGGQTLERGQPDPGATWGEVLAANKANAYQPLFFLLLNSLMRLLQADSLAFFRSVNLAFLGLALAGLLQLTRTWRLTPRLFLLGVFSFNAYLFMHVTQIREYLAGIAFYIWSTWVVLEIDRREQEEQGAGTAWFAGYGSLLTAGFYLQSWIVFPGIAQGLFLLLRRRRHWGRFLRGLTLTYLIVLGATAPYLAFNQQKVVVGLWASESESLESHLHHGFSLVFSGHLAGQGRLTGVLLLFWPAVVAAGAFLYLWDRTSAPALSVAEESRRQALLMVLCIAVSLAFQVGYTLLIENLAVWPRYFIIHYFFATWLIALSFRFLWELRATCAGRWPRLGLTLVAGTLLGVQTVSAAHQIRSFRSDPYLDTGQNSVSNWDNIVAALGRQLRPEDTVLMPDFITRATLSFTRPLTQRVLTLAELKLHGAPATGRIILVEPAGLRAVRGEWVAYLESRGLTLSDERPVISADGQGVTHDYHILVFARR
jgi:hypothetical protein